MVAVVMTVDVAWIAYRHWIKFVGLHRCVELSEIAVPSGDFLEGIAVQKTDGWFLCMVGKLQISFEFAVVECVFEAVGRAFR